MSTIGDGVIPLFFLGVLLWIFLFSGREYWDPLLAGLRRWRQRPRFSLWRAAAGRAGLENVRVDKGGHVVLGWSGELHVRLELPPSSASTHVVVARSRHGELALSVRPEGLSTALGKRVAGEREIQIGSPSFDAELFIQGETALVLALLDAETRAALARLVGGRVETTVGSTIAVRASLSEGTLDVGVEDARLWGSEQLASEVITAAVGVARRLAVPRDLAARIAENLRSEPEPGVRLECLATLARDFRDHPATREALLAARGDADLEVRLRAGIALGPSGRDVLLAIAGDDAAPDETAARAVAALAPELAADQAAAMLGDALRKRRPASARECMRALARGGGPQVVPTLARVLAVERGELAVAAASALGSTGSVEAESCLVSALDNPAAEVRAAAVQALGRVGTTAAVAPLKDVEERDRSCRVVARQAIAEIQSRLAGAGPGQLSLAAGESGELSLAGGEAGQLSIAGAEAGQLSIASGASVGGASATRQSGVAPDPAAESSGSEPTEGPRDVAGPARRGHRHVAARG